MAVKGVKGYATWMSLLATSGAVGTFASLSDFMAVATIAYGVMFFAALVGGVWFGLENRTESNGKGP